MKSKMITKVIASLAAACGLQVFATAPTADVVWRSADFTADFSSSERNDYTLSLNGNTGAAGYLQIGSGTSQKGLTIKRKTSLAGNVGLTVLAQYSNLSLGTATNTIATINACTNSKDDDRVGVYVTEKKVTSGLWNNTGTYNDSATTKTFTDDEATAIASGFLALTHGPKTTTTGTQLFFLMNGAFTSVYNNNGLKAQNDVVYGASIGGEGYNTTFAAANGMKVSAIAVFQGRKSATELLEYVRTYHLTMNGAATWSTASITNDLGVAWSSDVSDAIIVVDVTSDATLTLDSAVSLSNITFNVATDKTLTLSPSNSGKITASGKITIKGHVATSTFAALGGSASTKPNVIVNYPSILEFTNSQNYTGDQAFDFSGIRGDGQIKLTSSGNYRALPWTAGYMWTNSLEIVCNEQKGVILSEGNRTWELGSVSGSYGFRSDYGSTAGTQSRNVRFSQSRNTTWSGTFTCGNSDKYRIGTVYVAGYPGATEKTLTLSATHTASSPLNVESSGSVYLTGTWKGDVAVSGEFGGGTSTTAGTLTGNLTFNAGATLVATNGVVTPSGTVTFGRTINVRVASTPDETGIKVLGKTGTSGTQIDTAVTVYAGDATTATDGLFVLEYGSDGLYVKKATAVEASWNSSNNTWTNGTGSVVIESLAAAKLRDGDNITLTSSFTPASITVADNATVTITGQNYLCGDTLTIPESSTVVLKSVATPGVASIEGSGTLKIDMASTLSFDSNLPASKLTNFTGTLLIAKGRVDSSTAYPKAVKIVIKNGGQLYTSGATWENDFTISGNGWTGESNASNKCSIRGDNSTFTGTITVESDGGYVGSMGAHLSSATMTVSGSIAGSVGFRVVGDGTVKLGSVSGLMGTINVSAGTLDLNGQSLSGRDIVCVGSITDSATTKGQFSNCTITFDVSSKCVDSNSGLLLLATALDGSGNTVKLSNAADGWSLESTTAGYRLVKDGTKFDAVRNNPVTGESTTFNHVFLGTEDDEDWGNGGNWRQVVNGYCIPEVGSKPAPGVANTTTANAWTALLFDGVTVSKASVNVEGYWPKYGLFNGAKVSIAALNKLQRGYGTAWFMVDSTSKLTIPSGLSGTSGTIPMYVAAKDGVEFKTTTASSMSLEYYFAGVGSVKFDGNVTGGSHSIMRAQLLLGDSTAEGTCVYTNKLITYGSGTTATFSTNAAFTVTTDSSTVTAQVKTTEGDITTSDAVGTYLVTTNSTGVTLTYVGYGAAAKIGDTLYPTVQAAIDAAGDDLSTIVLASNTVSIPTGYALTTTGTSTYGVRKIGAVYWNATSAASELTDSTTVYPSATSTDTTTALTAGDTVYVNSSSSITVTIGTTVAIDGIAVTQGTISFMNDPTTKYALNDLTLTVTGGTAKLSTNNDGTDNAKIEDVTFVIGENGTLENYGWVVTSGTITFVNDTDKTIFTNPGDGTYAAKISGSGKIVKQGAGTLTVAAAFGTSGTVTVEEGELEFAVTKNTKWCGLSNIGTLAGAGDVLVPAGQLVTNENCTVTGTVTVKGVLKVKTTQPTNVTAGEGRTLVVTTDGDYTVYDGGEVAMIVSDAGATTNYYATISAALEAAGTMDATTIIAINPIAETAATISLPSNVTLTLRDSAWSSPNPR